jgi:hypothetical protein
MAMIYKIGTIGEFRKWTKQVVTDPAAAKDPPKTWFDSNETAAKSRVRAVTHSGTRV